MLTTKGICVRAVQLCTTAHRPLAKLIGDTLSDDSRWDGLVQTGIIKGKIRSPVKASETRGLVPQLVVLQLCNNIVLNRIQPKMNEFSREHGLHGVVLGCGKGGDTMDITFSMSQILEKARDRMSAGAVAMADVRKCHDELPWGQAPRVHSAEESTTMTHLH